MKLKPCFGWALSCNGGARYYLGSAEIAGAYNGSNINTSGVDHYRRLPHVGSTYGRCAAGMTPKPGRGVVVRRPKVGTAPLTCASISIRIGWRRSGGSLMGYADSYGGLRAYRLFLAWCQFIPWCVGITSSLGAKGVF